MFALGDAIREYGDTPAANCLRFIMLTGCRPGETMLATWDRSSGRSLRIRGSTFKARHARNNVDGLCRPD